ncbi:hypothetical protein [Bradyrhizobium sp. RT9a]|uniref:hypothetical protein n=1 Tax=Bradyrhizobium sp. RT9a TaxID=3156384 RepID=UPI003391B545
MMKTMSSVISAIAGALIGVTAAHADPVTLRVGYAFPARDGLFRQPIIERFMQQNPDIRIVTEANAADCPALLQQLLRAAVTGICQMSSPRSAIRICRSSPSEGCSYHSTDFLPLTRYRPRRV